MGNGPSNKSAAISSLSDVDKPSPTVLSEECDAAVNATQSHSVDSALSETPVIRQIILCHGEKLDDVIFLVKKGWTLRFLLEPSLCNSNVRLFVSGQSVGTAEEEDRCELTWCKQQLYEFGSVSDDVQMFADIQATTAGSFHYFFTVDGTSLLDGANGSGYFIVQPKLKVGSLKTPVPLHGIVCQTFLSKNLGPFSGWLERLMVAKKTGYNAIHFTPLQVIGHFLTT